MRSLAETTQTYLKKVFSDLHNIILAVIVGPLILGGGGIYLFAQKLWIQLKNIALSPTPLWVTVILVLGAMECIYLLIRLSPKSTSSKPKFDFVDDGDIKWKATLFANGGFRIEDAPFCTKHDLQLLFFINRGYLCQCAETDECTTILISKDYSYRMSCVESRAEQKFRLNGK